MSISSWARTSARSCGATHAAEARFGRRAFELIHPDDRARLRAAFAYFLQRPGVPIPVEYRARHKDGSWRHIEAIAVNRLDEAAIGGIVVNYRDVTERKGAEE